MKSCYLNSSTSGECNKSKRTRVSKLFYFFASFLSLQLTNSVNVFDSVNSLRNIIMLTQQIASILNIWWWWMKYYCVLWGCI